MAAFVRNNKGFRYLSRGGTGVGRGVVGHLHTGPIVHCFHIHGWVNGALLAANTAAPTAAGFTGGGVNRAQNPKATAQGRQMALLSLSASKG